uniref:Thylakoid lumenal 17.4 kDa protein, chloroplastic n=1 Tax=Tetradesmus obliquus TaxID=3088 RepID=A0A383V1S1_TETOB|eukprot:jgi/Sobl393_1/7739/SZX59507.1
MAVLQKCNAAFGCTRPQRVRCQSVKASAAREESTRSFAAVAAAGFTALSLLSAAPAMAEFRLPPIDSDPNRCERGYTGNTIGQANAVSDKLLDLRKCNYSGKNLSGKTLAGALLSETDMSNTNLTEAVLTKSYGVGAILSGADLTNAVVDRVDFSNAKLDGAKFVNAVVTGTTFDGADLTGSVWEDALIGNEDVKRLCSNPTLTGESRFQVGCRGK